MPVTMNQVLAEIDKDEPNYAAAAKLGRDALPHLRMIAEAEDPLRASKAAYLASLIGGPDSVELLKKAAEHHDPQVRLAVAHGLRNADAAAPNDLLERLLGDHDAGVRKMAVSTVGDLGRSALKAKVAGIAANDPEEFLRAAAVKATTKLK